MNAQPQIASPLNILITGANGQLGHKIKQILSKEYNLILTDVDNMDITDIDQVRGFIALTQPDFIIHGAAFTKVDVAEDEVDLCRKINAIGTKNIAEVAKENDIPLIYISTDYVFDGNIGKEVESFQGYTEEDATNPLSVYGLTKWEGEEFIRNICDKYYILRVSWLFGELPEGSTGTNFIETMIRLGKERDSLTVVNDQVGSPTYTKDLVEVMEKLIREHDLGSNTEMQNNQSPIPYGTYHLSGKGSCSWYDFAKEIFRLSNININVSPVTSEQYPQKAKRPTYSYMNKEKIEKALGITVRPWQEMVREYIEGRDE